MMLNNYVKNNKLIYNFIFNYHKALHGDSILA